MSNYTVPPHIQRLIEESEQHTVPDFVVGELADFEASMAQGFGRQQAAQSLNPLQAGVAQLQGNLKRRGLGAENSLLQIIQQFIPEAQTLPGQMATSYLTTGLESQRFQNRKEGNEIEEMLAVLQEEKPASSFAGDAVTFIIEALAAGKQFKHPDPKTQRVGRVFQEAGAGALYGLTEVGASDNEKAIMVAASMMVGAATPELFRFVANRVTFDPGHIRHITELAKMEKLFHQTGLLTFGELTGVRGARKLEAAIDNIPFLGLGAKRNKQRERFRAMVDTIFEHVGGPRGIKAKSPDEIRALKESLTDAIEKRFNEHKKIVDKAYDDVASVLDNLPIGAQTKVRLTEFKLAASDLLKTERQLHASVQNKALIRKLEGIVNGDPYLTFLGARKTLSRVKAQVRVERAGEAKSEKTGEVAGALTRLQAALIKDMDDFARQPGSGNAVQLLEEANAKFKNLILPFYDSPSISEMARGTFNKRMDIDAVVGSFLNNTNPQQSRATLGMLPPGEQEAARYLILREALDAASGGRPDAFIDPRAFANKLESMQALWKESFTPKQQEILQGFIVLADEGSRAFSRESAIGPLVAGGAAGMVGANKVPGEGSGRVAKWLTALGAGRIWLGTRAGTDVARAIARAQNSKELAKALRQADMLAVRWVEQNYPELHAEIFGKMQGPYSGFNPHTDPYLQSNPPRQDLMRRE